MSSICQKNDMSLKSTIIAVLILIIHTPLQATATCGSEGVWLQVLGSGGPELDDGRASSGYVIWHNGKARILLDMGGGSLLRFEQSGASLNDLDVVLLSHFHVDHSNDLPALIKASFFTDRRRDLPLYGPTGNRLMPSATTFVQNLLGPTGAFRYLSSYLDGSDSYRLLAHDVEANGKTVQEVMAGPPYHITAVPVHHGPVPALAWRVDIGDKSVVFSGDMNNDNDTLTSLARQADLLVAHHAIPEEAVGVARNLHMPPSVIGQIAANARVKQLVLSHRMNRTLGREQSSASFIRRAYKGPLHYADDLQCFRP
jgi:ribonuclease BN (tRNA processing enzyme)